MKDGFLSLFYLPSRHPTSHPLVCSLPSLYIEWERNAELDHLWSLIYHWSNVRPRSQWRRLSGSLVIAVRPAWPDNCPFPPPPLPPMHPSIQRLNTILSAGCRAARLLQTWCGAKKEEKKTTRTTIRHE